MISSRGGNSVYGNVGLRTKGTLRASKIVSLVILNSLPLIQVVK